ncbi:putative glycosyl transferase [Rosistilla ulvae]|uniref:Putative glycosyl transferase n=1 Tax=Rosistilla ulvae TaxID=1930277 RepID=A0A517M8C6_9BACT|nr:glycosyltransferase family 4 protein [Rosistilla ulvae]QDS91037.1 putative glycosyl transferase [Rosistilla ulvae]
MKLYYLSNSTIPSTAANSIHAMHMCSAFVQAGHDVTLFAGKGVDITENPFTYYGVPECFRLIRLPRPEIPIVKSALFGNHVARRIRTMPPPDLLYARDPWSLWRCRNTPCPLVFEAHSAAGGIRKFVERQLFRSPNFSHLVVISKALQSSYAELLSATSSRVRSVVAHDAAPFIDETAPATQQQRPGSLRIGYLGQLYAGKGAEIVSTLARLMPQHEFHIVGGRPGDVKTLKDRSAGVSNLVTHGFVPPSRVGSLRATMDVLVAPYQRTVAGSGGGDISRWMSPLKIFEYMSSGKAIVASELSVLREILEHNRNCLLVEPDRIQAWLAAIVRLEDAQLRNRLGKAARQQFEREHTWSKRVDTVLRPLLDDGEDHKCVD